MRRPIHIWGGWAAILVSAVVFIMPFYFIAINAVKDRREASLRSMDLPSTRHFWDNLIAVIETRDFMVVTAFINSARQFCSRRAIGYILVRNDTPIDELITRYLRQRGVLR